MSRPVHYAFTINNYNDRHLNLLRSATARKPDITYLIFGREVGSSGTPHLQGYLQLTTGKRMLTVKHCLELDDIHLEAAMGSDEHNFDYCSKDEDFEEFGERRTIKAKRNAAQFSTSTFDTLMEDIRNGASLIQLATTYPMLFIKHHAGIVRAHSLFLKKPFIPKNGPWRWNIEHDWLTSLYLWGSPGIGKTCYAQHLLPNALFICHMDQLKSYDPTNYDGIIFDDMSFIHMPREGQIHIVDVEQDRAIHCRHTCAFIPAGTKKIFLSNSSSIFQMDDGAIARRVTRIHLTYY